LSVKPNDLPEVKTTKVWLYNMFKANKDPEPLYVLDLILK